MDTRRSSGEEAEKGASSLDYVGEKSSDFGNSESDPLLSPSPPSNGKHPDILVEEGEMYEDAISAAGFGSFHFILLGICGWAVASDAVEIQAVSFVLPSACDLQLTSTEKGWLNAIIFVGMMIGGYAFGSVADVKGRRYVLMWSLTINGLFGLASSFSNTVLLFLAFRFFSGIGVGAAMPVVFAYFTEFMAKKRRGPMIGLLATFWMGGNIVTAGIAWVTIPKVGIGAPIGDIWYGSWRIFVALCAVPSLSSVVLLFLMPESPKFLQKVGRYLDAGDVFVRIYKHNSGKTDGEIPEQIKVFYRLQSRNKDLKDRQNTKNGGFKAKVSNCVETARKILASSAELFRKPLATRSWVSLFIWFTLSFGYYGLWMWFPELFQRIQSGQTSCGRIAASSSVSNVTMTCEEKTKYNNRVYFESFLVALSNLPGNLITILLINITGRRLMMAASMVISGISVFFFWFVRDKTEMLIMSCVFSGLATAGWNSLDVLSMELYPTHLRSTAFGIQAGVGRIGSILANTVFGELVDAACAIPLLLVACLLIIGGLSAFKLPKTDHESLH